jgi:hypothetical protein
MITHLVKPSRRGLLACYASRRSNCPSRSRSLDDRTMDRNPESLLRVHRTAARSTTRGAYSPGRCSRNLRCCPGLSLDSPPACTPQEKDPGSTTPSFRQSLPVGEWRAVSHLQQVRSENSPAKPFRHPRKDHRGRAGGGLRRGQSGSDGFLSLGHPPGCNLVGSGLRER